MVCFILFFRAIYKVLCDDLKLFMEWQRIKMLILGKEKSIIILCLLASRLVRVKILSANI